MDKLKVFINENRPHLDTEELPQHHFERFQQKWKLRNAPKPLNRWLVAGAAAIAGLIITAGLSLFLSGEDASFSENSTHGLVGLSAQIVEVDAYYRSRVNQKQVQIQKILVEANCQYIDLNQVLEDMNEEHSDVLSDIASIPHSEQATFVLTQYYQAQLNVLNNIIDKLSVVPLSN